jgi:hypothetical protein
MHAAWSSAANWRTLALSLGGLAGAARSPLTSPRATHAAQVRGRGRS